MVTSFKLVTRFQGLLQPSDSPKNMDFSWRRQIEYYDGFYQRDFGHYWLPYISSYQQPVFVAHMPVPVWSAATSRVQTLDKNLQKCRVLPKSKSKATKLRDKQRKQRFMAWKSIIVSFPFFGLNDDEFRTEIVDAVESRETKTSAKLTAAEKAIQELQNQKQELNEKLREMDLELTKQNEERIQLQKNLDIETTKVNNLVLQNVEREREAEIIKEKLTNCERCGKLDNFQNSLIDRLVEVETENQKLNTENQNFKHFIDSLPRKWKDKSR